MALKNNEETSNIGTRWTIEEDKKLVKELTNNKSYEEIALDHKRTINGIKSRVISHIIYPKYKDGIENNIDNISKEYNIDNETIMKYINKSKSNDNKNIIEYLEQLDNKLDIIQIEYKYLNINVFFLLYIISIYMFLSITR